MKYCHTFLLLCLLSCSFISVDSHATWIDFEELPQSKEFSYKAYTFEGYQIKASKYYGQGIVTYYGFLLQANMGDSNEGENFLSVDSGSYYFLPGITISRKDNALFNLNYLELGKLYDHDGYFQIKLSALDKKGDLITEQYIDISYGLATISLNEHFKNISLLLINGVYVDDLKDTVARFAIDNVDLTLSEY